MIASPTLAAAVPAASPFLAYLRLEVRRTLRNRRYVLLTTVFPALLYVLYTAVLSVGGPGTLDGLTWPEYFLVSMACYGAIGAAMGQAAPIAMERRGGWIQHLRVTPLPGGAYVVAKVASAVILTIPALALVVASATLVDQVQLGLGRTLSMILVIAIGSMPFAALGILVGYVLDAESAQGGMVLAYFSLAILGGLFAPLDTFPGPLATIGHVLPSSHLASLGRSVAAGGVTDPVDVAVLLAWTVALGALAAWRYVRDDRAGRA